MNAARLSLACLVAVCLTFVSQPTVADDKDDAAYSITIKRLEVKNTKQNGDAWDINDGKPDLCVIVRNLDTPSDKAFETKEATDAFTADFNAIATTKIRQGQSIEFEVVDKDVAANDLIGKISKKMTAEVLKEGKMTLGNFGQVLRLEVEIKKQ